MGRLLSPPASNAHVRKVMRGNRSRDTTPELSVRRLLSSVGYRYRLHRKDLPGKPDIVFADRRKLIFVHGCFGIDTPDARWLARSEASALTGLKSSLATGYGMLGRFGSWRDWGGLQSSSGNASCTTRRKCDRGFSSSWVADEAHEHSHRCRGGFGERRAAKNAVSCKKM